MLSTESYTLDAALEELDDRIADLEESLGDLEQGSEKYQSLKARRDRVSYLKNGLRWQRDEVDWGGAAEIELGSMTAGEEAMMHRDVPESAAPKERRLWFVAASTVDAPYHQDDLEGTFSSVAGCHPAFVEWIEAKVNGLGIPGGREGNPTSTPSAETETSEADSSTSSRETAASETSTDGSNSSTTSSSDSPTA